MSDTSFCEAGHVTKTSSCDTSCSAGTFSPGGKVTECQSCGNYKECVKESVEFDDTENKKIGWYKCPYYSDKETNGGCQYCPEGFYVNLQRTDCNPCPQNCAICSGGYYLGDCTKCKDGFKLDVETGDCVPEQTADKTECSEPFVLINGKCELCPNKQHYENKACVVNKYGCVVQIGQECFSCDDGFALSDGECNILKDCDAHSPVTCETCEYNSTTTNGLCYELDKCIYANNNGCLHCIDKYYT